MHEGAEMSEDPSLRSCIFSSKGTAVMFCCYGNTLMESVYIIQSYNTQMCISLRNIHVSPFTHQVVSPTQVLTHTTRSGARSF